MDFSQYLTDFLQVLTDFLQNLQVFLLNIWNNLQNFPWGKVVAAIILIGLVIWYIKLIRIKYRYNHIGFSQVVGLADVKKQLYDEVLFPFYHAKDYKKFNLSLPNGIILYGPPGCGKTFLVERLAEELGMNYIKLDHSEIASPYIHETVSKIADVFDWATVNAPCLVFIDEIESLVPSRKNMVATDGHKHEEINEFLLRLDNAGEKGILVIGATNHLKLIDPAVLRSGRFDLKIHIPPPDLKARAALFRFEVNKMPHDEFINFSSLGKMTEGYSCSDITHIVKTAARIAVSRHLKEIDQKLLEKVISDTPSSVEQDDQETDD